MKRIDRIGEAKRMNNGLLATVIGYRNVDDVDIEFQNGKIVYGKQYQSFKNGEVKCPMIIEIIDDYAKVINPNTDFEFLCDLEDIDIAKSYHWCNRNGYAINDKAGRFHRIIMSAPNDMYVDHINHDGTDNRKKNLRLCTNAENQWNTQRQTNNISGYKGVGWYNPRKKWRVLIQINGKKKYIGIYDDKIEAAKAYNEAAIKYHGEFACLNEI